MTAAISEQAEKLIHIAATDYYEPRYLELLRAAGGHRPVREGARLPHQLRHRSGGGPIKLARHHTGRPAIIAFEGAFGRTMVACSSPTRRSSSEPASAAPADGLPRPVPAGSFVEGRSSGGDGSVELEHLRNAILGRLVSPEDVAAIVFEPIQGEGGYFPRPRPSSAACARSATSTASSSSPTRSSRAWAAPAGCGPWSGTAWSRTWRPSPRASPRHAVGAFIGRRSCSPWPAGSHGSTFAGNPVCCAAALATLDLLEAGYIANAEAMGERLRAGVEYASEECGVVRDIRGKG